MKSTVCRIVDNMPMTWCYEVKGDQQYCSTGFPIGCYVTKQGVQKDLCRSMVSAQCLKKKKKKEKEGFYIAQYLRRSRLDQMPWGIHPNV
jgi:hypothetical protein